MCSLKKIQAEMPRNLLAMAVGIEQKTIVDQIIQKVSNLVAFGHLQQMS
jgi:hypothetical protein